MGFSNDVRTNVLLKCKRYCCLCGQYVGTNIELHHIKQKADYGNDSEDNCIPLCFNCHASVKYYNPKHPKGLKYSEKELKRLRDNFYESVRDKVMINYSDNDIKKVKKILDNYHEQIEKIIEIDPSAQKVNVSLIIDSRDIISNLQSYSFIFENEELDRAKCNLIEGIREWYNLFDEKHFHVRESCYLCFNSDSVNSYYEIIDDTREKIRNAYFVMITVVTGHMNNVR